MAFKRGSLVRVLEDRFDTEGLDKVGELLCTKCNTWFPNPARGTAGAERVLEAEIVIVTGLKESGPIKVVASDVKFAFHYASYENDTLAVLRKQRETFLTALFEFSHHKGTTLGLRVKEEGNPNTWLHRLDKKRLRKALNY